MTSLTTGSGGQYTNNGENALSQLRYLWRGGRYDGDGVVLMGNGAEQDTHRGTPLGDDAFADATYQPGQFFSAENGEWTTAQERYGDAGTQGQWSTPSTDWKDYFWGEVGNTVGGMARGACHSATHPVETYNNAVDGTAAFIAAGMIDREGMGTSTVYSRTMGVLEGTSYIVSSAVGARQMIEGGSGYELTTSNVLDTNERISRGFGGLSQMAFAGAGLGAAYLSPVNQLSNQVFGLSSFKLGGYGVIRSQAIAGTYGIGGGVTSAEIGLAGEFAAGRYLIGQGVRDLAQIQNASGHGIDLTGEGSLGRMFAEVKSSRGSQVPGLSAAQKNIGSFVRTRLERASGMGPKAWRNVSPATQRLAQQLRRDLGATTPRGSVIEVSNLSGWVPKITPRRW